MFIKINIQGRLFKRSLIKPRFNKSLEMCSLVGYFKKINTFLVYSICFHKTVHNKWCLDKTLGKISKRLRPRPNVELFTTRTKVCWVRRRSWDAGGDPGFFLAGGALFPCSTSTPINHILFFFFAKYQLY